MKVRTRETWRQPEQKCRVEIMAGSSLEAEMEMKTRSQGWSQTVRGQGDPRDNPMGLNTTWRRKSKGHSSLGREARVREKLDSHPRRRPRRHTGTLLRPNLGEFYGGHRMGT